MLALLFYTISCSMITQPPACSLRGDHDKMAAYTSCFLCYLTTAVVRSIFVEELYVTLDNCAWQNEKWRCPSFFL